MEFKIVLSYTFEAYGSTHRSQVDVLNQDTLGKLINDLARDTRVDDSSINIEIVKLLPPL